MQKHHFTNLVPYKNMTLQMLNTELTHKTISITRSCKGQFYSLLLGFLVGCFVIVTYRFHSQITTIDNSTKEKKQIMKNWEVFLLLPLPHFWNYHKQMYFAPDVDIPVACGCGLERFSTHIRPRFLWLLEDFISQGAFFPSYGCFSSFDEFPWQLTATGKRRNGSVRQIFYWYVCVSQSWVEKRHGIKR